MSRRIAFIDLAKGFCIILVVLNHVMQSENLFVNQFFLYLRLPLYFFLSGLFFKDYGSLMNFMVKKTNKLLIPYISLYAITIIGLESVLCIILGRDYDWNIWYSYYTETSYKNTPIWFLLCLFEVNVIFYILIILSRKKVVLLVVLCLLTGLLGYSNLSHYPFYLDSALTVIPFYLCGYLFKNYSEILYPNRFDKWNLLLSFLCLVGYCLLIPGVFTGNLPYVSYGWNLYELDILRLYLSALVGILMVLFFAKHWEHLPFISYIGRYSIIILGTHQLVHLLVLDKCFSFFPSSILLLCLKFFLCLFISSLLIPLCRKYFPYFFAQKDLLPYERKNGQWSRISVG